VNLTNSKLSGDKKKSEQEREREREREREKGMQAKMTLRGGGGEEFNFFLQNFPPKYSTQSTVL